MTGRRRRVAFVLSLPYPAAPGGGERFVSELAAALRESVDVVEHYINAPDGLADGSSVHCHRGVTPPGREGYRLALSPGLLKELTQADVIHVHQYGSLTSFLAAAIGRLTGRPVFVTDHGASGVAVARRIGIDRLFVRHLAVSEFALKQAGQGRGEVIYGGARVDRFRPGTRAEVPFVLYAGRLVRHKGVDWLIRSLPEGARLVIAGRTDEAGAPGYLSLLQSLSERRNVSFELNVTDAQIIELYQSAWVLVLPALPVDTTGKRLRVPELLGLTLLEAMACGTPVIASAVGALPEVVSPDCGYLVEPGDQENLHAALATLLSDRAMVERLGAAGRRRVEERFTWAHAAQRCVAAYEAALRTSIEVAA